MTSSEENYLKTIYHLSKDLPKGVSTNAIAEKMQTKASSVTDMMQRMAEKGWVNYVKYQGVTLTKEGSDAAIWLIRKHRLWEVFLVEVLKFSWDEVHEIAEQLEHIKSRELINRLDAFLEYPSTDPHGDPIPDKEGNISNEKKRLLGSVSVGEEVTCVGVKNTSKEFLQYLDRKHIGIGDTIKVLEKESFDDSTLVVHKGKTINLSSMITHNIYVK